MSQRNAKLLLLFVFIARGTSFLFSKHLLGTMTPENILAVRFLLSFIVLAAVFRKKLAACTAGSLKGGVLLGVLYAVCMFFEMYGLKTVDTGVSSFIENMAIVLVPLYVAALTRTLPRARTLFCALLAITGVGFLSLSQTKAGAGTGLVLVILAALTYGVCIIATEKAARMGDPLTIGMIQLGVMGAVSAVLSFTTGGFALPGTGREWAMILMLSLVCSCFGFAFQPLAQKYVNAETAAVFTVVNPLTTSILGTLVEKEGLGVSKLIGYLLILTALILYNRQPASEMQRI